MKTRSDDLQLLLAVVDSGSFSAAAQALQVQVAKISRAVTRLEKQLGTTLLNRTTRRLELTDEGARFVDAVRPALAGLAAAEEGLGSTQLPAGRLRVDAASPFMQHQIVPHVGEFLRAYPDIELELSASDGVIDLLERRTDVAIRVGALQDSSLHARALGNSPLHIVASPSYLAEYGTPTAPAQLIQHRLLGFIASANLNRWPLAGGGEIQPSIAASSGITVRQLALAGEGVACLSQFMVQEDLKQGRLISVLTTDKIAQPERETVSAVYYRHSVLSPRIQVFLDFLQPRLTL
ncbi:LysR family transcriptional regulator [Ferrimonas pelagia]|uniref:LysR family transcriptional regulator n=1 Tax=Ferrimonas pelagia TaxID=1177826 RepID=A0ABP9FCY5_9GAMM